MAAKSRPTTTCDNPEVEHPGFPCAHAATPQHLAALKLMKHNQLKSWSYASFACDWCALDAASENVAEVAALIEHARYDHSIPAGITGQRAPQLLLNGAGVEREMELAR